MNQPKNPRLAGSIAEMQRQESMRILQDSERAVADLSTPKMTERRKFPEEQFRRNFLPVVSGEAYKRLPPGYTPERLHDEAYNFWCQVAGGPTGEVDVVEPDGTVAFTVPALMDTSIMNIAQPSNRAGLRALNKEYIERSPGMPHVAKTTLQVGLAQQISYMFQNTPDPRETNAKIKKMHEYYGIKPVEQENKTSGPTDDFLGELSFD
jgi:hypothetical protein